VARGPSIFSSRRRHWLQSFPRYTRNGKDFTALDGLVDVTEV
jgi:hypothetical protein